MLRIYVSHTWMEEGQCVDFPLMNRGWKHTRCQVPRTQSATDHTRRHPPARYPQNPQIPARDDSFILPRCSRPGLCLPERSTDNLFCLLRGERMWESLKCFFFFLTLKPTERCRRGGGGRSWSGGDKDAGSAERHLKERRNVELGRRDKNDSSAPWI